MFRDLRFGSISNVRDFFVERVLIIIMSFNFLIVFLVKYFLNFFSNSFYLIFEDFFRVLLILVKVFIY